MSQRSSNPAAPEPPPSAAAASPGVVRRAFVDSLPVMMGYLSMGFVAGVLLAAKANLSLATLWAFLTSAACVSGTFNFAIVQPVAERAPIWAIALMTAGMNFRYLFYGFAMLGRWRGVGLAKKAFLVHMLSDENFAIEASRREPDKARYLRYCLAVSAFDFAYWVAGVTAGALAVAALAGAMDPETLRARTRGMEFAMAALFIVILTDQAKGMLKRGK